MATRNTTPQVSYIPGVETDTKGVNIGRAREVTASQIGAINPITNTEANRISIDPVFEVQSTQLDRTYDADYRAKQLALAQALERQMLGQTPSLAELQLRQATERNLAGIQGSLASQRGIGAALAMRQSLNAQQQLAAQASQDAALLRLQEIQAAQAQLAGVTSAGREAEYRLASTDAELLQQKRLADAAAQNTRALNQAQLDSTRNLFNAEQSNLNARQLQNLEAGRAEANARLQQEASLSNQQAINQRNLTQGQLNAQIQAAGIGASASVRAAGIASASANYATDSANMRFFVQNALGLNQQQVANSSGYQAAQNQVGANNINAGANLISGGAGAIALAASDKKLKEKISPGNDKIQEFLDALKAHKYEYKNKSLDANERISPMAQELEKSELGELLVTDAPEGKFVDYGKGLGLILAAQAQINERLKALESRKVK